MLAGALRMTGECCSKLMVHNTTVSCFVLTTQSIKQICTHKVLVEIIRQWRSDQIKLQYWAAVNASDVPGLKEICKYMCVICMCMLYTHRESFFSMSFKCRANFMDDRLYLRSIVVNSATWRAPEKFSKRYSLLVSGQLQTVLVFPFVK